MLFQGERRAFPRVAVRCPINYFYLPPSLNPPDPHVVDLTLQGARVEAPDPLIPGSVVAFQIVTSEHQVVDARARVIYTQAMPDAFFRVGVRFTTLSESARALIARELECARLRHSLAEVAHDASPQPIQAQTRTA